MKKDNEVRELSFEFALKIIDLYKYLKNRNEFILSKQILEAVHRLEQIFTMYYKV